jgi:menaquinone-9 beta-reductase
MKYRCHFEPRRGEKSNNVINDKRILGCEVYLESIKGLSKEARHYNVSCSVPPQGDRGVYSKYLTFSDDITKCSNYQAMCCIENRIGVGNTGMKTKVLIIGAGPAGSMAAYRLASRGFHDFILVDRCNFPRMKPCAGGISPSTHNFLKKIDLEHLLADLKPGAKMKRVRFVGPQGQDIIMSTNLKAMTINRHVFDAALLEKARSLGARFIPGFTVRELMLDGRGWVAGARDGERTIEAEVTILANGGRNREFREKYFADRRPLRLITSRIGWWRNFDLEEETMEMVFDRDLLPHYGWVFPEGDGIVNIGICLYEDRLKGRNVTQVFDAFLEKHYAHRLEGAEQVGKSFSFVINTTGRVKDVYAKGMLYAGEAGRLCNPATAEGISYAMESGSLAADAVMDACEKGIGGAPDEKSLERYEAMCRKSFNFRLMRASLFRSLIDSPVFNLMIAMSRAKFSRNIIARLFGGS